MVEFEAALADEVELESMSPAFQLSSQPFGFAQQPLGSNILANHDIEIAQRARLARPDTANCMVDTSSISPAQSIWNSTLSSSTPESPCDLYISTDRVSTPLRNETLYQESHETDKAQISVLRPFRCPHCPRPFLVAQRFSEHLQSHHKHIQQPNICDCCGKHFTLSKDLKRHLQTVLSTQLFACKCGKAYKRKDGLQRHIGAKFEKSKGGEHRAV